MGFNLGQYWDEQQHSLLAHVAEAFIMTLLSSRQRDFSTLGLMGPLRPLVWMGPNLTLSLWFGNSMHWQQQGPGAEQQLSLSTPVNRQGAQMMQELGWDEQQMQGHAQPTHLAGSTGRHRGGQSGDAEQSKAAAVAAGSIRPRCSQEAGGGQA